MTIKKLLIFLLLITLCTSVFSLTDTTNKKQVNAGITSSKEELQEIIEDIQKLPLYYFTEESRKAIKDTLLLLTDVYDDETATEYDYAQAILLSDKLNSELAYLPLKLSKIAYLSTSSLGVDTYRISLVFSVGGKNIMLDNSYTTDNRTLLFINGNLINDLSNNKGSSWAEETSVYKGTYSIFLEKSLLTSGENFLTIKKRFRFNANIITAEDFQLKFDGNEWKIDDFVLPKYQFVFNSGKNAKIIDNNEGEIIKGSTKTYLFTANEGYNINEVLIDGKKMGTIESYTFENIDKAHSITIVTQKIESNNSGCGNEVNAVSFITIIICLGLITLKHKKTAIFL